MGILFESTVSYEQNAYVTSHCNNQVSRLNDVGEAELRME